MTSSHAAHPLDAEFLHRLASAVARANSPHEIASLAVEMTGEYLGANRCYFAELSDDGRVVSVNDEWHAARQVPVAGTYALRDFLPAALSAELVRHGVAVADIKTNHSTAPLTGNFESIGVRSFAAAPFVRGGQWVSILAATDVQAREWRTDEIELLASVAARVWPVVERAREENQRRCAEEALRVSEERLRLSYRVAGLGAWEWTIATNEVFWSPEYREIYGLDPHGLPSFEEGIGVVLHEDRSAVQQALTEALQAGQTFHARHRINHPRKGLRWLEAFGGMIMSPEGHPLRMLGVVRDVTDEHTAEEAVRRSEEQLRTLADSIPQLAWMAEADGAIVWYNRGWYAYTGTTLEQMQGWGWQSVHDPAALPEVLARWRNSVATGEPFEMEFPIRGVDGEFRWFLTRVNPLRDASGRVLRWFGTNTDVHEVRRAREALQEETRILDLLNKAGITIGSTLELQVLMQSITDSATELSGAQFGAFFHNAVDERGEVLTLYTLSGAPREAFEKFGHPRATPIFGPTFRGEGAIRLDDVQKDPRYGRMGPHHGMPPGHLPVRSYLAVPVISRSKKVLGGLFFGHPEPRMFTERSERLVSGVAAQAAVAIDNARLYDASMKAAQEREQLLESERHARTVAEVASREKDDFLATLSHELRTPLTAILGWAHVLSKGKTAEEDLRRGLEVIERNARAQTHLIEDLLDMSRITSGKMRLSVQPVLPATFIEAAVETVRPAAEAKGVRLECVLDPNAGPISGDPDRLQQVMWNLLSNAIKFTPRGGKVQVIAQRVNSHIEVNVSDSGAGITPELMAHLFERFRQADASTTRQSGGLGLGLAIVKNLVEMHGGTVNATSAGLGKGSNFCVCLPLAAVGWADPAHRREHPGRRLGAYQNSVEINLTGIKVLVVDDQIDARELVSRVLTDHHAEVIAVGSAEEALTVLQSSQPDVLISDIGMPSVDGYELMRRVRALERGTAGAIPAIALTAFARSEDRTRALREGFQVHIAKPVEPEELVASVASVIRRKNELA